MSSNKRLNSSSSPAENLQFRPWLVQQISSGKYKDLEWIDDDRKRIFKLPWTKKNYPNWEEHHQIFIAWAKHRASIKKDVAGADRDSPVLKHVSLLKSNFRTILRKCCDIEELTNFHQLGLQTGNYKVYKILDAEEAQLKRSMTKREKNVEPKTADIIEITQITDPQSQIWLPDCKIPKDWIAASGTMGLAVLGQGKSETTEDMETPVESIVPNHQSQFTRLDQFKITRPRNPPIRAELEEPAFDSREVVFLPDQSIGSQVVILDDSAPNFAEENNADGFQMLLEAAEISDDTLNEAMAVEQDPISFNIENIMQGMNIPSEQLDQYEIKITYNQTEVWSETYDRMGTGYRIHYGNHDNQRFWVRIDEPERIAVREDFDRTPISLPLPEADPLSKMTSSILAVLEKVDAGVVIFSDGDRNLRGKRLCQSRVFAVSNRSGCGDDKILQLERYKEVELFSYRRFLEEVSKYAIDSHNLPDCEIKLALGRRPRDRHSKVFIGVSIVPKAALSLLECIDGTSTDSICYSEEKSIDKMIRLFS